MMVTMRTKVLLLMTTVIAVAALGLGQSKTRLQVCATSDRDKADTIVSQINMMGYGPAEVRQSGQLFKVMTKAFDSVGEANLAKPRLKGAGFVDAWCVADDPVASPVTEANVFGALPPSGAAGQDKGAVRIDFEGAQPAAARKAVAPELRTMDNATASEEQLLTKIYAFSEVSDASEALGAIDTFVRRFPKSPKLAAAKLSRAHWLMKLNDDATALAVFEQVAREHPTREEAGEAKLRCGYLGIKLKKPDLEVFAHFRQVANGEVVSTPPVRLEAMLRCAAYYHKAKDLDTAEAAYVAVAKASQDIEVKAFAQMQAAAITLEKAWNGKATFAQARQLSDEVVVRFPTANKRTRATAALVALETLAYEKNYAEVLVREAPYIREFADTAELQLAYYWFALAHLETGDPASAKAIVQALLEAKFPTQERFRLVDVTTSARRLLERIEQAEKASATHGQ